MYINLVKNVLKKEIDDHMLSQFRFLTEISYLNKEI